MPARTLSAPEAAALGTVRRAIRKALIDSCGHRVQSHVDGSLSVFNTTPAALLISLASIGIDANTVVFLPAKVDSTVCFATAATVAQGSIGRHGYRGTGTYSLTGSKDVAFQAGGLQTEAVLQARQALAEAQQQAAEALQQALQAVEAAEAMAEAGPSAEAQQAEAEALQAIQVQAEAQQQAAAAAEALQAAEAQQQAPAEAPAVDLQAERVASRARTAAKKAARKATRQGR